MSSGYEIRPYQPGDEAGIVETFNTVFSRGNPDFVPRTLGYWRWAYADNPAGIRAWVAERDGVIACHYASQPYFAWHDGECLFGQIVDSMVHPEHGRGLKRPGLFVATATQMLEAQVGAGKVVMCFGLPQTNAWRIGRRLLSYGVVRSQCVLARAVGAGPTDLPAGVEALERFDASVNELYVRCRDEWSASVQRDERFLNWRFVNHPQFRYRFFGVRDSSGSLQGYAVFRVADVPHPNVGLIVDWLVPPDAPEVGRLLVEAALGAARSARVDSIITLFPEWAVWFRTFQDWGWLVRPTDHLMTSAGWNDPKYTMAWLRENWWHTLAETDLV